MRPAHRCARPHGFDHLSLGKGCPPLSVSPHPRQKGGAPDNTANPAPIHRTTSFISSSPTKQTKVPKTMPIEKRLTNVPSQALNFIISELPNPKIWVNCTSKTSRNQ